jgi:hypothetical protein
MITSMRIRLPNMLVWRYFGGAQFESWMRHWLSCWSFFFCGFRQSIQANVRIGPSLDCSCFLPNSNSLVIYHLGTESVIKKPEIGRGMDNKWIIKSRVVECGLDSAGVECEAMMGSYEYGREPPGRTLFRVLSSGYLSDGVK